MYLKLFFFTETFNSFFAEKLSSQTFWSFASQLY